ncbi:hypothetical protein CBR_g26453 [Chara braunii]|uniref:Integrase catalytic domain-containing protein n=1 Tax=Chara braunii TaxID=69332 RepID=A0A388L831_CHABU|nr:hypothetical protein CBR_g26453 [Chara braunii]|eukprot:GBG78424.1 hypothetical protein CBR_g26453 [Chara braunii]
MLDAADENERLFFHKLYDDAVQREREAAAAARAANIADQVALLRIPEANADRFQEGLAAAVAALVRLRTLEDLESRVTALEQQNQELQAELLSLKQSQLSAPRPPNPRPAAVPVSQPNTVLVARASGTVTSAGSGTSSSSGSAGSSTLVIVPNAGTSAQNATVLTGVQYSGPMVDKRAATLPSKYDGKGDITSWIMRMRKEIEHVHLAFVKPLHVPSTFAAFSTSVSNSTSTTSAFNVNNTSTSNPVVIAVNSQSNFLSPDEDDPPPKVPTNIRQLLDRFPEVLAEPRGVPQCPVKHKIEIIEGSVPPKGCVYCMGQGELEELRRKIDDMIDRGWIRPSESEFGAPVLFVPKKGGKLRMCIDYRGLNPITRKNAYPSPRIDDLLDAAGGCKVFSKIDLKSGYHQIEVDPSDQHKTAFKTRDGLYEFIVMPFGLTNAPATFQCLMDKVLRHQLNRFVVVYLDDILIFSKTMEEHLKHLEEVLQVLKEAQLHLNLEKFEFGRDSVIYLGQRKLKEDLVEHTAKDPDLSPILEQLKADPNSQPHFHECEGLVFRRYGKFDRLCVPNHAPLRTHFLDLAHGQNGHFGFEKTYGTLLQQVDWPGMKGSAQKFIAECQVCQRTKVHRHKPYGLLRPLPIPNGPGESISIDFTDMGKVSEVGNSQVMVIVDHFSKFMNLIPFPPHAPTELVIEEFHQQYILQFGVPKTILSDRDTRFISKDWKDFTSQIYDIKLNMTSGRHPEANGLVEEINQTVIQLLPALIVPDQNTWDKELHKVKGLYNNSIHSATGVTPNQLQYGWPMRNPLSYLFPERSPGLMPDMPTYNAKYARLLKAVIAAMNKRQHAIIKHANKLRKEEKSKVGDYVSVKMSKFFYEEGISRKLLPLYYGPWQILKVIGDDFGPSYVIDMPPHLRTYQVFHASKLFPHIDDETFPFRNPMIPRPIDGSHEIDKIVSHEGKGRNRQYKVHFLYHPLTEFFWINRKELLKSVPRPSVQILVQKVFSQPPLQTVVIQQPVVSQPAQPQGTQPQQQQVQQPAPLAPQPRFAQALGQGQLVPKTDIASPKPFSGDKKGEDLESVYVKCKLTLPHEEVLVVASYLEGSASRWLSGYVQLQGYCHDFHAWAVTQRLEDFIKLVKERWHDPQEAQKATNEILTLSSRKFKSVRDTTDAVERLICVPGVHYNPQVLLTTYLRCLPTEIETQLASEAITTVHNFPSFSKKALDLEAKTGHGHQPTTNGGKKTRSPNWKAKGHIMFVDNDGTTIEFDDDFQMGVGSESGSAEASGGGAVAASVQKVQVPKSLSDRKDPAYNGPTVVWPAVLALLWETHRPVGIIVVPARVEVAGTPSPSREMAQTIDSVIVPQARSDQSILYSMNVFESLVELEEECSRSNPLASWKAMAKAPKGDANAMSDRLPNKLGRQPMGSNGFRKIRTWGVKGATAVQIAEGEGQRRFQYEEDGVAVSDSASQIGEIIAWEEDSGE